MRVCLVVNPIAGMGGRVGLKGTDGKLDAARERGAEPRAPDRAVRAAETLNQEAPETTLLAGPGAMGADEARQAGFDPTVVGEVDPERTRPPAATGAADTRTVVRAAVDAGADVLLFVGGDGTATDVAEALDTLGVDTPMLGVPAGVKVYSSVFAVTPEEAGRIVTAFDRVADREVNDIDEDAYREGEVHTDLRAVRPVPVADGLQSSKQLGGGQVSGIAAGVAADVTTGTTYVLGPGSTLGAIKEELGIDGTALGVDVWRATDDGGELLVADATAEEIRDALGEDNVVVVSPIGGQGFVFGRGNHQISPAVIDRSEIEIVAAREKLDELEALRVDLDDPAVEAELRGWWRVRTGRVERRMMKLR